MFLPTNEKQFGFWKMRRSGMSNISIANLIGITRQGVSQALLIMDEKIEASLREMAQANRIQIEKIDVERGVLFGRSIPFQTNAYILVSEKHGLQVWYEHDGNCISCDEFTKCIEFIWDFAAEWDKTRKDPGPDKDGRGTACKDPGGSGMTSVSEIAEHWFGLCRKAPVLRASQTDIVNLPEPAHEGRPDGGAGGPETIRRGIGAALSGTKTLIHNPQLLWFSLLVGLVLAVHLIAEAGLNVLHFPSGWLFFVDADSVLPSLVLTFMAGLLTVFCLGFLLAGLALSLSSKKDGPVSFFQGLRMAKKYLIPLTGGSMVAALAGIQIFVHPFIARGVLFVRNPRWLLFDPHHAGIPSLLVQTFAIELLTVFCLGFLLAGLVLSLSSKEGGTVSFFQGLRMAKKYLRPLTGWSVVVALAGTLIFIAGMFSYELTWFQPFNIVSALYFKLGYFLFTVRYTFPFNFVLVPSFYVPNLPPGGGESLFSWALECTLILSAITVFLFVLTLFVVPLLVLEGRSLKEAVLGSFTLMKKIWGEVAACVLGLGMVVFAAWFAFLLFRFSVVDIVGWVAGPMNATFTHPSEAWIAAGLLYSSCPVQPCVCRGNGWGDCSTEPLHLCKDPGRCRIR